MNRYQILSRNGGSGGGQIKPGTTRIAYHAILLLIFLFARFISLIQIFRIPAIPAVSVIITYLHNYVSQTERVCKIRSKLLTGAKFPDVFKLWVLRIHRQQEPLGMYNIYKKKGNVVFQFLLLQEFHGKVQIQYFRFRGSIDA